jgi:L-carnitine CoA-transferase
MAEERPAFGILRGLRIVCAGSAVAAPFAAVLFAENGADVIHVESSNAPDVLRQYKYSWAMEHRNMRQIALDIPHEDGRKIFERLIKNCDIFIESSKGGTYKKWGLEDDVLWEINPALVIVHVSGYGQEGDPAYIGRASYDFTGQAFSGYALFNGLPDMPLNVKPSACDYVTGLQAAWAALAAVYRAKQDGKGESIDVAQYEALLRLHSYFPMRWFMDGTEVARDTGLDPVIAGKPYYKTKNGKYVSIHLGGGGPIKRGLPIIGLADDPDFQNGQTVKRDNPELAAKYIAAVEKFAAEHTDDEVVDIMNEAKVACSKLMTYEDMVRDPHYQARGNFVEYFSPNVDKTVKGVAPIPKFKNNPGQIWRGGGKYGQDNEDVLRELGFNQQEIEGFYESKAIAQE